MVLPIVSHEHFAGGNSIPLNQPTIFHASQIAKHSIQQTFLLAFCVPLFQQSIRLRIPTNCQCKSLFTFQTAQEISQTLVRLFHFLSDVSVFFAKLAKGHYGRSILEQLHSDENMKIMHINLRFFRVSDSPWLLLNICIEAPESITKCLSLSSGFSNRVPALPKLRQESGMFLLTPF